MITEGNARGEEKNVQKERRGKQVATIKSDGASLPMWTERGAADAKAARRGRHDGVGGVIGEVRAVMTVAAVSSQASVGHDRR